MHSMNLLKLLNIMNVDNCINILNLTKCFYHVNLINLILLGAPRCCSTSDTIATFPSLASNVASLAVTGPIIVPQQSMDAFFSFSSAWICFASMSTSSLDWSELHVMVDELNVELARQACKSKAYKVIRKPVEIPQTTAASFGKAKAPAIRAHRTRKIICEQSDATCRTHEAPRAEDIDSQQPEHDPR